jgi:hypothetical protein
MDELEERSSAQDRCPQLGKGNRGRSHPNGRLSEVYVGSSGFFQNKRRRGIKAGWSVDPHADVFAILCKRLTADLRSGRLLKN